MPIHPLAGRPAPAEVLVDPDALVGAYYDLCPDPSDPTQRVAFGTSGHRGSSLAASFNEGHVLAIAQAIAEVRREDGVTGPLFLGKDTHALSTPAERTALEVLAAHGVTVVVAAGAGLAPTPVISREILVHNATGPAAQADGIVITPSHNPPADGGLKYNPPHGGPAGTECTRRIERRANALLEAGLDGIRRMPYEQARSASTTIEKDFVAAYVGDLGAAIDVEAIRSAGVRIGVDPLGGSALPYVQALEGMLGLDVRVVNDSLDPRFDFMSLDHDGKIRMDCSSPYAMASLIGMKDEFDVAFGMDPDADRHGIVTPSAGLLNPNHYLAVAIQHLLTHRADWSGSARIGKTLVSSALLDRVILSLGREVFETPVGFKYFAPGLADGTLAFGGEESAGASFLRRDGTTWTTDKDGILLGLLAAEVTAVEGRDAGEVFAKIAAEHGRPSYRRVDRPATPEAKAALGALDAGDVHDACLAGEPITACLTRAPGNDAPIGGLKIVAEHGWFAARPSGTEAITKVYAESLTSEAHLDRILADADAIVGRALGASA